MGNNAYKKQRNSLQTQRFGNFFEVAKFLNLTIFNKKINSKI